MWLYELCRFLTMKANNLIIAFFAEDPPCSSLTCPEMRAAEWQYLCAVHDPPKSCCAIDYCCHTLDWATNILTSPKFFPSRLTLGSDAGGGPQASMRHLTNIFRRLYRIFAHAWYQHRQVFWQVEGNDGLYIFLKAVCDMYGLIPEGNYTVPPEAEGLEPQKPAEESKDGRRLTILRKDDENAPRPLFDETETEAPGATTRRHKHSPSTGSHVTTIAESTEDAEDQKPPALETQSGDKDDGEPNMVTAQSAGEVSSEGTTAPESEERKPELQPAEPESPEPQTSDPQQPEAHPEPEPNPFETKEEVTAEQPQEDQPLEKVKEPEETTATEESDDRPQSSQETEAETTTEEALIKLEDPDLEPKPAEKQPEPTEQA